MSLETKHIQIEVGIDNYTKTEWDTRRKRSDRWVEREREAEKERVRG